MNIVALIDALVKSGATPEMILSAVKSQEEDRALKREANRQRQIVRRKIILENNIHVTNTGVPVTVTPPPSSSPLSLLSPTPPYNSLPPSSPSPENNKISRAREISDFQGRHRLQFEIPAGWSEICKQEMGWNEKTTEAVWVKFSGHWKRKIGNEALKTDEEWDSEWRIWVCSSHIKQQKNTEQLTVSAPKELTPEEKNKQAKWYKKTGIQHKVFNPEGITATA